MNRAFAETTALVDKLLSGLGDQPLLRALLLVLAALILARVTDLLLSRGIVRWTVRTKTELDDHLVASLHRPLFTSVLLLGLWLATLELKLPAPYQLLVLRVFKTVAVVVWTVFGFRIASLILELVSRLSDRVSIVQPRTLPLFDNLAKVVLSGGAVYFLFLSWGIDVTAWLASAGIIGIAVGFAAKDTLANLFSGVFIMADAPYQVGDFIVLDSGERGRVTQIGLRSTRLLTRDDIEITLPNAAIANAKIMNESGGPSQKQRLRVRVGVAYGSDVDQVREVLLEVALSAPEVSRDPEPRVRFRAFGESSLDFELLCWIDEPVLRGRVLDALNSAVYKQFQARGIEIPFPKRDVYVRQMPG